MRQLIMDNPSDLVNSIKTVKHFQNLSLNDLRLIVTAGAVRRIRACATIFTEGEPCAGMFVLMRGMVHLCKIGPQGQINIMAVVEPIIMFNEITVLDGGPNPVTAVAVKDCIIWQIGYDSFQALLEKIPQVGLSLLRVLARRNRQMIMQYEDLSFRSVMARMAKLLLDLSDYGNHPIDRRACSINEMASRISTVPEAISRSLNLIKQRGVIRVSRTEITVLLVEELATLAQVGPHLAQY
jgi:CRP/FNR family cyclic AMP-dependent transcriptional regulator